MPLKIALLNDWFLKYTTEQAVGLRSAGADVAVVCRDHLQEFNSDRHEWQERIGVLQATGVRVLVIRGRTRSLEAARSGTAAAARLQAWRPDVVHAHPSTDPWLHVAATGFPLVLTVHDPVPHEGQPEPKGVSAVLDNGWRSRADAFVVHGQALKILTLPVARERPVWVIPHGLKPTAKAYSPPERHNVLLFGRLEPYKGIAVLVEAMRRVWEQRPDVELTVAGEGPAAKEVPAHRMIRRLLRYIPEAEVDGLLASATLVAAPYTAASQSGVVSLALSRGIPTIVSDQGALPDLAVEPGLLVAADDAAALSQAILSYLDHGTDLRLKVHNFARSRLSWEATARQALELYPTITRRSRS
jgi:alpha-maltose-1-phosphate synthase